LWLLLKALQVSLPLGDFANVKKKMLWTQCGLRLGFGNQESGFGGWLKIYNLRFTIYDLRFTIWLTPDLLALTLMPSTEAESNR